MERHEVVENLYFSNSGVCIIFKGLSRGLLEAAMALYGVDLHSQGKNVVLQMRLKVKRMGPLGIRRIEYHFQQFDPELTGSIQLSETHEALNASGLFPSVPDLQAIYKNFQDEDGFFKYVNFIHALRPALSARQEGAITAAFKTFGTDPVPIADILLNFDLYRS